jgi:hypothetical protein
VKRVWPLQERTDPDYFRRPASAFQGAALTGDKTGFLKSPTNTIEDVFCVAFFKARIVTSGRTHQQQSMISKVGSIAVGRTSPA